MATFKAGGPPPYLSPQINSHVGLWGRHWGPLGTDFQLRGHRSAGPHMELSLLLCGEMVTDDAFWKRKSC